jgi:dTDP-4-amino-4,6-dideoxygalactose transaminase
MKTEHDQQTDIPLVDLARQSRTIRDEVLRRMADVIDNGRYILGKEVEEFELKFAEYCGVKYSIGVANGTDAIHLALRALDIGPGDEVITAGNSFAATAFAIAYTGAKAVFVDINADDYNLDPNLVEDVITDRTKAIIPVHLYGQPARMQEILEIAKKHDLYVVEDAAQAHGAEVNGQRIGSFGDVGCFSFYPGKNLGAFGDAGGLTTQNPDIAEKLRLLRNYGQRIKNRHDLLGYNCRMDTLQACVLLTKLQYIEQWTEQRRQVSHWYQEELAHAGVILPTQRADAKHVFHLYVIRHPQRDQLIESLAAQKIYCGIHYPNPLPLAAPFRDSVTYPMGLPNCTRFANEIVSLPMYPELTREQVARVGEAIRSLKTAEVLVA